MPMTPAQKRAHDKYDREHYTNLAIRITKQEAEAIRRACYEDGTTPAAVMREAIRLYMKNRETRAPSPGNDIPEDDIT